MTLIKHKRVQTLLILFGLIFSGGCKVSYDMAGVTISPEVKTVSIQYFENRAPLGIANLGQMFTDELKDKFKSQSSLTLVTDMGHLNFEGEFTDYTIRPVAIQGNETAAQNRLTITIRVKYTNEKEPDLNFDTKFTRYKDWDSNTDISSVEEELVTEIIELLIDDIFNKSVVNW
ncbi:MAG: hypothetical protein A2X13_05810 [Bacteroidetes bacterium GWC2_33_15]|nr:MAG: hypothetical protein A2X10_00495 [Bacteroidetes bacterium GWA2_33_15]OFX52005.1 MAG: hypothetical protein A2X13_05810 [Bacteroidetes bacterium GWC2_33_15]OFX63835.1 MAG: hypothetical protein A2X15_00735 [Bacteroidetes bacterium GWB2_32_14]OFX67408.1 MAG: hypothetical protein A2X14_12540 [Bacteroidetes bacterium GWD2_33_33]HAN17827.1 hypothetical protein [Bacteroidales bacterium]